MKNIPKRLSIGLRGEASHDVAELAYATIIKHSKLDADSEAGITLRATTLELLRRVRAYELAEERRERNNTKGI